MARKSKYKSYVEPYLENITDWIKDGDYEYEICQKLGVSVAQWEDYKNKFVELPEAIKKGKQNLLKDLKISLYKRAKGFTHTETKHVVKKGDKGYTEDSKIVKYIPPSETALIFAMCNLDPDNWKRKDKEELERKEFTINVNIDEEEDED